MTRFIVGGLLLLVGWGLAWVMAMPPGSPSLPLRAVADATDHGAEALHGPGPDDAWLPADLGHANWEALFHAAGR